MTALLKRYLSGSFVDKFRPEGRDLKVESFESGWDIIESDLSQVKVAIVDLLVPRLSGLDFLKHLKAKYPHISFIPISGMATEPTKRQVRELLDEAQRFLEKPLRREEFQEAFSQAWSRTQSLLDGQTLATSRLKIVQPRSENKAQSPQEEDMEPMWTAVDTQKSLKVIPVVRRGLMRKRKSGPETS